MARLITSRRFSIVPAKRFIKIAAVAVPDHQGNFSMERLVPLSRLTARPVRSSSKIPENDFPMSLLYRGAFSCAARPRGVNLVRCPSVKVSDPRCGRGRALCLFLKGERAKHVFTGVAAVERGEKCGV